MQDVPIRSEHIAMLEKVFRATKKGALEWERTADPSTLLCSLGDDLSLRLGEVPDVEGKSEVPDYRLEVLRGSSPLFTLDRTDVADETAQNLFRDSSMVSYHLFRELWEMALMRASGVDTDLKRVNQLLNDKLAGDSDDIPF
jgi:hypothetical protein